MSDGGSDRLAEQHDRRRVVDGDEVVGLDVQSLERPEEERPVLLNRPAERGAELLLPERRLVAVDRVAGRRETLEVRLRIQDRVPEEEERVAAGLFVPLFVMMFTTPTRCLAELRRVPSW